MANGMLSFDILFNIVVIGFDVALLTFLARSKPRLLSSRVAGAWLWYCLMVVITAYALKAAFGHRIFAVFRAGTMALFWHGPVMLSLGTRLATRRRASRATALVVSALLLGVYVDAQFIEPRALEITRHTYAPSSLRGLEQALVVVQVSDFQAEEIGAYEERVFREIAALEPDLILYTGDYFHLWPQQNFDSLAGRFADLVRRYASDARYGAYAVGGDTERGIAWNYGITEREVMARLFGGTGTEVLFDETRLVPVPGGILRVVGLSVEQSRYPELKVLAPLFETPELVLADIVIGHAPEYVMALSGMQEKSFLALAGHTHGGQIRMPFLGPPITASRMPRKYADCFLPYGTGVLSVSRGIGMERLDAPRIRFLCRPELRVILLPTFGETAGQMLDFQSNSG